MVESYKKDHAWCRSHVWFPEATTCGLNITTPVQFFPHGAEYSPRLGISRHGCCSFPHVCSEPRRKDHGPSGTLWTTEKPSPRPLKSKARALQSWVWPIRKREGAKRRARWKAPGALSSEENISPSGFTFTSQTLLSIRSPSLSLSSLGAGGGARPSAGNDAAV